MDVLQLLKNELKERQSDVSAFIDGPSAYQNWAQIARHLKAHLTLELEYLLPELAAVSPKQDAVLQRLETDLVNLRLQLNALGFDNNPKPDQVTDLRDAMGRHVALIEDRILPLMRQRISTADREELYDAMQDAKQDIIRSTLGLAI
ncbi:MAG: hypothetical protein M3Q07_21800 [Pseudobdellovibrionaceae bacterium]|nr:hypothetical protein [Pseudobdellovibrionaceae bacterium]